MIWKAKKTAAGAERARLVRIRRLAAAIAVIAAVVAARFLPASGIVYFTGLDDSAQSSLSRGFACGAPLVARDDAFAAVPPPAREVLLYRPAAARKTRDLARQVDTSDFSSRPFFQPFLPLQRAFLPGLPVVLAAAVLLLAFRAARRHAISIGVGTPALAAFISWGVPIAVTASLALLTPWPARFCLSPFSEGVATLLAALALALAFSAAELGVDPCAVGFAEGALLGLSVSFHPILSAFAVPIVVFAVLRTGRARHVAGLAVGVVAGLAPLVWSTKCVTAPYGDFLSLPVLRAMLAGTPAIRSLAKALACAVPAACAILAAALSPRIRAATERSVFRTATAIVCAASVFAATAAVFAIPVARDALRRDGWALLRAMPAIAALCAVAFARRRPAACFVVAAMFAAAIPCLAVQGGEVHVGIWSLRRSLPFATLIPLAAFFGALETSGKAVPQRRRFTVAVLLLPVCAAWQLTAAPRGYSSAGERGAAELVRRVEELLPEGALALFSRIPDCAPFAATPDRDVFGLNDAASNALGHSPVVAWLRDQCDTRPVFVVANSAIDAPISESGIILVPVAEPVCQRLSRIDGKSFDAAVVSSSDRTFTVMQVLRSDSTNAASRLHRTLLVPGAAFPFGLVPGGWDTPRRGKTGRWASDGAAFFAPIPAPGETLRIDFAATWWTRNGTNESTQTLVLEPPFPCDTASATLVPAQAAQAGRWSVTRSASDTSQRPATGSYRIRATVPFDEAGYPPALAARFESISATILRQ